MPRTPTATSQLHRCSSGSRRHQPEDEAGGGKPVIRQDLLRHVAQQREDAAGLGDFREPQLRDARIELRDRIVQTRRKPDCDGGAEYQAEADDSGKPASGRRQAAH
jgi:hypothetical protein